MKNLMLATALLVSVSASAETSVSDVPREPTKHLVSIEAGALANGDGGGSSARFGGVGIRYARTLLRSMAASDDTLSIEGGVFYYTIVNQISRGDVYQVLPVSGVLQYGIPAGNVFRPYVYGGVLKSLGFVHANGSEEGASSLSQLRPAIGVGLSASFKGIIARADFGTDLFGAGLAYGF